MSAPPTVVVVAAVLRRGDRILLTRRPSGTHLAGYWEFPGGKLDPGESPEEALARECREEIGLDVRAIDILDVAFHRYTEPAKAVLLLFYACEEGTVSEVRDIGVAEHVWVRASELRAYALPPPDARLVGKLEAGLWPERPRRADYQPESMPIENTNASSSTSSRPDSVKSS